MQQLPYVYLDTGALSFFSKNDVMSDLVEQFGLGFAFSGATIGDRYSATKNQREFEFLQQRKAVFLEPNNRGRLEVHIDADPSILLQRYDPFDEKFLGSILNRVAGGGPDISDKQAILRILETIPNLPKSLIEKLVDSRVGPTVSTRNAARKALYDHPKLNENESLKSYLARILPKAAAAYEEVFPIKPPENFDQLRLASLSLNLIDEPAKGLQGERNSASKREVLDGHHIACALHCALFLTTDKSTLKKHKILADYWAIQSISVFLERIKRRPMGRLCNY
ncbi:hypothetical protein [Thalassovita sp.]|uniref:hypothetical protein n=1 Tax=Thalassovita sp. TaxID=1979401 RepID=UPI003B59BF27